MLLNSGDVTRTSQGGRVTLTALLLRKAANLQGFVRLGQEWECSDLTCFRDRSHGTGVLEERK